MTKGQKGGTRERNRKKERMTGYHFISSTVELRLINALLSVCCDPARAVHEGDATGKRAVAYGEVEEDKNREEGPRVVRRYEDCTLRYPFIIFRMFHHAIYGEIQIKASGVLVTGLSLLDDARSEK